MRTLSFDYYTILCEMQSTAQKRILNWRAYVEKKIGIEDADVGERIRQSNVMVHAQRAKEN